MATEVVLVNREVYVGPSAIGHERISYFYERDGMEMVYSVNVKHTTYSGYAAPGRKTISATFYPVPGDEGITLSSTINLQSGYSEAEKTLGPWRIRTADISGVPATFSSNYFSSKSWTAVVTRPESGPVQVMTASGLKHANVHVLTSNGLRDGNARIGGQNGY